MRLPGVKAEDLALLAASAPTKLLNVDLDCSDSPELAQLNGLQSLVELKLLQSLKLNFSDCLQLTNVDGLQSWLFIRPQGVRRGARGWLAAKL